MQQPSSPARSWPQALLLLTAAACSGNEPIRDPVVRTSNGDRASLLAEANRLAGREFVVEEQGPWQLRRVAHDEPSSGALAPDSSPSEAFFMDEVDGAPATARSEGGAIAEKSAMMEVATMARAAPGDSPDTTPAPAALRAGSTDDNADYEAYCAFLAEQVPLWPGACQDLDLTDRRRVTVRDENGTPLPSARVTLVDEKLDQVVWRGTTYGDGSFYLFPGLLPPETADTFLVEVQVAGELHREHWDRTGDASIDLPGFSADRGELALDVLFLIDTTGSMSDEIDRIKQSLLGVTAKLRAADQEFDLRYGAVLYRDVTDQYVTKRHPFIRDIEAFDAALREVVAGGGGDTPESLNQGLAVAIDGVAWRPGAAKLVFLVADAAPHMDYENDIPYGDSARAAIAEGIKVHAVAASGLSGAGTVVFRQVAQMTGGKFVFIEYGEDIQASAAGHGVSGEVKSNNLDDILFEQIQAEIDGWARRASAG